MSSWSSYPSIFAMGHRALKGLLDGDVNVEEKVDGSQFSFGLVPANTSEDGREIDVVYKTIDGVDYALKIRSKGCVMHIDAPEKMFSKAAETVRGIADLLTPGYTYRGEYLSRPAHNALVYERVPNGNIIIFDINTDDQGYLSYEDKAKEASRLGLETVPLLFSGRINTVEEFRRFLASVSILGGQAVEGVVVKPKNYNLYGTDKKVLLGKFVSEAFKEVHRKSWGESNPSNKDIITQVTQSYASQARWNKAIQHLREAGKLTDTVKDIGPIIKEIPEDILMECEADIKDALFKYAWPHIRRGVTAGFPQYYKELLLKKSFEDEGQTNSSEPTEQSGERVHDGEPTNSISSPSSDPVAV